MLCAGPILPVGHNASYGDLVGNDLFVDSFHNYYLSLPGVSFHRSLQFMFDSFFFSIYSSQLRDFRVKHVVLLKWYKYTKAYLVTSQGCQLATLKSTS